MKAAWNWVQNFIGSRTFFNCLAVATLVSLGWGLVNMVGQRQLMGELRSLTDCVAEYSNAQNENTKLRAEAAAEERAAQDELFSAIAESLTVPVASRQRAVSIAFNDWAKARARIEGKREVLPIPDPPSVTCG